MSALFFSNDLQAPGSSMTESSCCSVGRPLWLTRPPRCPTSRGSPGHSSPTPPGTPSSPSRRSATTARGSSVRTRGQVQHFSSHLTPKQIRPSFSTQWLCLPLFPDDAQFEMDMWGRRQEWSRVMSLFYFVCLQWENRNGSCGGGGAWLMGNDF